MRQQPLDVIRQVKPPPRCTDEELIDRLMQGEFFKLIKGELKPSPIEVMNAGPRSKQEAKTLIKKYEKLRASDADVKEPSLSISDYNGVKSPALVTADGLSRESCPLNQVAPDASETKTKTPWTEIIPRVIAFISEKSIALIVGGLGLRLAYIQLGINYDFWRSQGQSLGAADQFGNAGYIIEILLLILGPMARILRKKHEWFWFALTLLGVLFCLAGSTYASWNFAARNIDDGAQRRADAATDIVRLQRERDDLARLQLIHLRDGRINTARADADQIQYRDNQIRELQPKAGTTAPDIYNIIGKGFYTCIPSLSGILIMIAFLGLMGRSKEQEGER